MHIPEGMSHVIKGWVSLGKNAVIELGIKYDNKKILVSIDPQFKKFKEQIRKSLKEVRVEDEDISTIISLVQNNYKEFYPDIDDPLTTNLKDELQNEPTRLNIPNEEWQSTLIEKYTKLHDICDKNFPGIWPAVEFTLSIKNILHIGKVTLPFAGIILGPPSSAKTLVLEMLRDLPNTFYTDSFTPRSFVSHNSGVSKEQLEQIDMLPKIKNKLFMTPELGPIFSSKDEELTQILGIFTRILDGHGYESDSGAFGHRGYSEEIMFAWVGAAVDIPRKVYKLLSTLGPKLYFFRIRTVKESVETSLKELKENNFIERKNDVKLVLLDYIRWFEQCPTGKSENENTLMKIEWESSKDEQKALELIIKLGHLLAPLRGFAVTWETKESQGSEYAYGTPTIEHPTRAITSLANLAKGHALLEGRNYMTMNDIPIIVKTVLSTAPVERVMIFDLLLNSNGELTTSDIEDFLNISKPTALRTMTELKILGLVNLTQETESSNSVRTIKLKGEFEWFLSDEFKRLRQGFVSGEKRNVDDKKQVENAEPVTNIDEENKGSIKKKYPHVDQDNALQNGVIDIDTENSSNPSFPGKNSQDYGQEKKDEDKS